MPLKFHSVTAHHFRPPHRRAQLLWKFLRPERGGRQTVLEGDDGNNKYRLRFRAEAEREAFLTLVKRRIAKFRDEQAEAASGGMADDTSWRVAGRGLGRGRGGAGGGAGGAGGAEAEAWRQQRVEWGEAAPLETSVGEQVECLSFKLHVFDADR